MLEIAASQWLLRIACAQQEGNQVESVHQASEEGRGAQLMRRGRCLFLKGKEGKEGRREGRGTGDRKAAPGSTRTPTHTHTYPPPKHIYLPPHTHLSSCRSPLQLSSCKMMGSVRYADARESAASQVYTETLIGELERE